MGYFSKAGEKKNLLNHYDRGRLIQQSYYGDADGSRWGDKPWRLNPVQGGDYRGAVPPLVESKATATTFHAKSIPLHWATGAKLDDFALEQWIELPDDYVHARFRMTYRGKQTHAPRHQELPAVFLDPSLSELVLYQGPDPWTGQPLARKQPGQTNEYFDLPERWAAFVDKSGHGVGVCVPAAPQLTSYRFRGGAGSDCSYLAPIATFALQPNMTFEYDAYFIIGKAEEIRARCETLVKAFQTARKQAPGG